jgi:N-acetylmuramoyl-L-alanine amidase
MTMKRKPKLMIDGGHGGHDSGAVGPTGLRESDVTLAVAMLMGSLLVSEFEINYTRRDDRFVSLGQRAALANDWQADAFISLHCNAGPPGRGEGYEVFTTLGDSDADDLATELFRSYGRAFPTLRRRMDMTDGDPDKEAGFAVLRLTEMPAVLFELEFIHTGAGEIWLSNPRNQASAARALAAGVRNHFKISTSTENA